MTYIARLHAAVREKNAPVVVGLDPRWASLPDELTRGRSATNRQHVAAAFEEFCLRIIDVVAPLVPAVKPQSAFFEAAGPEGMATLQQVIAAARRAGLIVICDAKRGDIGSTAEAYAQAFLAGADPEAAPWAADALTVNPYLGPDTLEPFVQLARERDAGLYVLARTSNPGAGRIQDHENDGRPLYETVARLVDELNVAGPLSDGFGSIGAVAGATYPEELRQLRAIMPHTPLLVPGYGSQGAGAADVAAAFTSGPLGAVINCSRAIIFAEQRDEFRDCESWEAAVEAATVQMVNELRQVTTT